MLLVSAMTAALFTGCGSDGNLTSGDGTTSATPVISCQQVKLGTLIRLPVINRRKVGMTSNHHALYVLGYTRATMATTERSEIVR